MTLVVTWPISYILNPGGATHENPSDFFFDLFKIVEVGEPVRIAPLCSRPRAAAARARLLINWTVWAGGTSSQGYAAIVCPIPDFCHHEPLPICFLELFGFTCRNFALPTRWYLGYFFFNCSLLWPTFPFGLDSWIGLPDIKFVENEVFVGKI